MQGTLRACVILDRDFGKDPGPLDDCGARYLNCGQL